MKTICNDCGREKDGSKREDPFVADGGIVVCNPCWHKNHKPTEPTDTSYVIEYQEDGHEKAALVIAQNPIQARRIAIRNLFDSGYPVSDEHSVKVKGELREAVKAAESNEFVSL